MSQTALASRVLLDKAVAEPTARGLLLTLLSLDGLVVAARAARRWGADLDALPVDLIADLGGPLTTAKLVAFLGCFVWGWWATRRSTFAALGAVGTLCVLESALKIHLVAGLAVARSLAWAELPWPLPLLVGKLAYFALLGAAALLPLVLAWRRGYARDRALIVSNGAAIGLVALGAIGTDLVATAMFGFPAFAQRTMARAELASELVLVSAALSLGYATVLATARAK